MNKIIFLIIGLPGSGKSTLIKKIKRGYLIDDIESVDELPSQKIERIFISDPNFCRKDILEKAHSFISKKYPEHRIACIFFENNYEKALNNDKKRKGRNKHFIKELSKCYNPPKKSIKIRN